MDFPDRVATVLKLVFVNPATISDSSLVILASVVS